MGTRNETLVVLNGKYALAQYGQWDGYPEGQGETARKFLREKFDREKFIARLGAVHFMTQEEIEKAYEAAGHKRTDGEWVTESVARKFNDAHPFMTRDHGAKILELIQDSEGPILVRDDSDFVRDSLMCEWAYVVDLDKNTFEVYKGFNTEPLPPGERFSELPIRDRGYRDMAQYYPVKHVITFMLDDVPRKDDFLKAIERALPTEEEDAA